MRIFRAELHEEGSFDEAVKGCDGIFHVAASMEFSVDEKENIGNAMTKMLPMKLEKAFDILWNDY